MKHPREATLRKVGRDLVELARERTADLLTGRGLQVNGRNLEMLLVNAYLQGAVDGAHVEQLRAKSRGRYNTRRSRKVA